MNYTIVVGLEVHVQLLTRSKLFCGCANKFNPDHPNVQTCPVCLGLPGALPVMNEEAFRLAVKTALALNCQIPEFTKWDRKQYYYPDLPKAYQISQYDLPFSHSGWLDVDVEPGSGDPSRIRLIRAHLEEDAGKNIHDESGAGGDSRVDLNRTGTPLLEIVSEPDIRSPLEARRYLEELRLLLTFLGVSDCNMQEGSLRCDANINLHIDTDGEVAETPIVELKNMNSFRNVELALEYEATRQYELWTETGNRLGDVAKQTRGWDANSGKSFAQRGKEEASDYRYFPDPDLVPVTPSDEWVQELRDELGELPAARRTRYEQDLSLSAYDAGVIVERGPDFCDYFEAVTNAGPDGNAKLAANWVTQDVLRELNERGTPVDAFAMRPDVLGDLLARIDRRELTTASGREVFVALLEQADNTATLSPAVTEQIIQDRGLAAVSDTAELESIVAQVIAGNERAAEDFRAGKQAAVGPLIGQVMKQIRAADPQVVRQLLIRALTD